MQRYSEDDIAAEEERIGSKLPEDLRTRYLEGAPEQVILSDRDEVIGAFDVWGPSTTTSDKKGREYPTPGMAKETQEIRDVGEDFLTDEVVVAWAQDDVGNLGVVLRDGTLGWWKMHGGEIGPVEIDWDPSEDDLAEL